MHAIHQTLALLAFATPFTALALPADPATQSPSATSDTSINHSKLLSDQLSLSDPAVADSSARIAANGKCIDITFTTTNPNFHYKFNGDWGAGSGKLGSLGTKSLCGSGAMFVGQQNPNNGLGSAAGGNTKLECTVKGDGKKDNVCNVSVVDWFSLWMHCTGFGTGDIGGTKDLFELGQCPKRNPNGPTCVNTRGHTNNAAQFFKNGGKCWYQDNKYVATTFAGTPRVKCAIGK